MLSDVQVKRLHPDAKMPERKHNSDAGADLYTVEDISLAPGEKALARTGLAIAVPEGYVGYVTARSGVSFKTTVILPNGHGTVDAGYRNEVFVPLVNLSKHVQSFEAPYRIAQLVIQKVELPEFTFVDELDDTDRGMGGFGSTGTD